MKNIVSILTNAILATILLTSVSFAFIPSALAVKKFVVYPTGIDDTDNIQAALNAAVASGPRSTVELTAGTFYLTEPIVVWNFDGTFKGAGKDKTIVQTLGEDPFPTLEPPFAPYPTMFSFNQDTGAEPSHIKFSDMTIRAVGETVEWLSFWPTHEFQNLLEVGSIVLEEDPEPLHISTTIERMGFEGEVGDFYGYNAYHSVQISGLWGAVIDATYGILFTHASSIIGTQTITESSFKTIGFGPDVSMMKDSRVEIEENEIDDMLTGIQLYDFSNSAVEVEENNIKDVHWWGVLARQAYQAVIGYDFGPFGDLPELSSLLVGHNAIHGISTADGVGIVDFAPMVGAEKRLDAVISDNRISLDTWYGGVFGRFAQDVKVLNNRFEGYAGVGVYMGIYGDSPSGWEIIDNNMDDLDAYMADVWLGPGSSDCFVRGKEGTVVLDEGTDNTIIIGH